MYTNLLLLKMPILFLAVNIIIIITIIVVITYDDFQVKLEIFAIEAI